MRCAGAAKKARSADKVLGRNFTDALGRIWQD
jgi:hypothetical protein